MDWETFVNEHYSKIYGFIYQFLGSKADAEDATQEAFLRAYKSYSSLREPSSAKAWIYSIARNVCIDKSRWWKRYTATISNLDREDTANPKTTELTLTLRKLINELPIKQREVFILRHWHDFDTKETAKLLSISEGTVKSHLKRAIDKIKKDLEKVL